MRIPNRSESPTDLSAYTAFFTRVVTIIRKYHILNPTAVQWCYTILTKFFAVVPSYPFKQLCKHEIMKWLLPGWEDHSKHKSQTQNPDFQGHFTCCLPHPVRSENQNAFTATISWFLWEISTTYPQHHKTDQKQSKMTVYETIWVWCS